MYIFIYIYSYTPYGPIHIRVFINGSINKLVHHVALTENHHVALTESPYEFMPIVRGIVFFVSLIKGCNIIIVENRFLKIIIVKTECLETEIIGRLAYFEYISNIISSRFRTIVTYYDRYILFISNLAGNISCHGPISST